MTEGKPMTPDEILRELDEIPWAELQQAFGKADDDPRLLRAIVADGEDAGDALWELSSALVHQGTVWPATRYAVPFLARIAAAGIGDASHVVGTLGFIADSAIDAGFEPPEDARLARAAVTAHADMLFPLLCHADPMARAWTAWTLAKCEAPEKILPALRGQFDAEQDFVVRATLMKAMEAFDPGQAAAAASLVGPENPPGEQLIAAEVSITAGLPWTPLRHDAATAWLANGTDLPDWWWIEDDVPFGTLLLSLARRGDLESAIALSIEALRLAAGQGAKEPAVWAAGELAKAWRVPIDELAIAAAGLVGDPAAASAAIQLLRELGPVPETADAIHAAADSPGPGRDADWTLVYLIEIGDPRAARLLIRDLPHRGFALDAAATLGSTQPATPLGTELLGQAREALRAPKVPKNVLTGLLRLVGSFGEVAAAAIPEVRRWQRADPDAAARALARLGDTGPASVAVLREAATDPGRNLYQQLEAARRLRKLTGEDEPLHMAIRNGLAKSGAEFDMAVRASRDLAGSVPDWLVPALLSAFERASQAERPDFDTRALISLAVWRLTGDPAEALAVTSEGLRHDPPPQDTRRPRRYWARKASAAASELGPAAMSLIPDLRPLLDERDCRVPAAQALLRIAPGNLGGVPVEPLVDQLVEAAGDPRLSALDHRQAVALLREILCRHPDALSVGTCTRLSDLAERPQRLAYGGLAAVDHAICDDEGLRSTIRDLLAHSEPNGRS